MIDKRKVGELIADRFETTEIRDYFLDMCEKIPDYIFTMPSSTTGKYHNATQCQRYGQLYHMFMFSSILEHLLRLKHYREMTNSCDRDLMRCVPFFHDAVKCGWNGSQYTVFEHPLLAAEWVLNTTVEHDTSRQNKQIIADLCAAHSGEWSTSKRSKTVLPEPKNELEFLIHECDILASRADLDWIIAPELKELLGEDSGDDLPNINEYRVPFGKHAGMTIPEIDALADGYLNWASENITREPFRSLLESYMKR